MPCPPQRERRGDRDTELERRVASDGHLVVGADAVVRGAAALAVAGVLSPRFGFGQADGAEKDPLFARSRVA